MSVFTKGNTALITGGASGIGLAVAQLCRQHGMHLALVDSNSAALAAAKTSLTSNGTGSEKTETYVLDVSDLNQWTSLPPLLSAAFPQGIDFVMLNAGTSLRGGWENAGYFRQILETNLFGVINGLNTLVPVLQSQQTSKKSAIVLTGSKQGITNPPGNPAYNASKAAVKTLAEHLSFDMRGNNTSVHLLVPGWTFTGMTGGGATKEKPAGAWEPAQVADFLKQKMDEGSFWAICPDNDVTESDDRKRMMWTAGDAVFGRPPLSRWREEYKDQAKRWMEEQDL